MMTHGLFSRRIVRFNFKQEVLYLIGAALLTLMFTMFNDSTVHAAPPSSIAGTWSGTSWEFQPIANPPLTATLGPGESVSPNIQPTEFLLKAYTQPSVTLQFSIHGLDYTATGAFPGGGTVQLQGTLFPANKDFLFTVSGLSRDPTYSEQACIPGHWGGTGTLFSLSSGNEPPKMIMTLTGIDQDCRAGMITVTLTKQP
jgi:hypothetical protein